MLPRIHRPFKYAFIRASTTTVMQEASLFMLISDMFRGVPAVYNTFFAYDEVAHHSGIDRPDAFKVLRTLDRVFAKLERASDAGAASISLRRALRSWPEHGRDLQAALRPVAFRPGCEADLAPENRGMSAEEAVEGWGNLNLALNEAIEPGQPHRRLIHRAVKGQIKNGDVALGPERSFSGRQTARRRTTRMFRPRLRESWTYLVP